MTIEVRFSRPGGGHLTDARRAVGRRLVVGDVIDAMVIGPAGIARSPIEFILKPSGRGAHVVFRCPPCQGPCAVLFPTPGGALACARCTAHRTRRQTESSRTEWEDYAVELEDRLLRGLARKRYTPAGLGRLRRLAGEICAGDEDRFAAVLPALRDALRAVDAPPVRGDRAVADLLAATFAMAM